MAKLDKFLETFEESSNQDENSSNRSTKFQELDTLQQSLAIVKTIDKLKEQGVPITKKAEIDYLLAKQVIDKANVSSDSLSEPGDTLSPHPEFSKTQPIKRNPKDNPAEFKAAMDFSKKTVSEVEMSLEQGDTVSPQKLEVYELCKKFLKKYN